MKELEKNAGKELNETITLTVNKKQSMLLGLGLSILPNGEQAEDIMKMSMESGEDKSGVGVLLGLTISMLDKTMDKSEREDLKNAIQDFENYGDNKVTVDRDIRDFVQIFATKEKHLLEVTNEEFEHLLPEDQALITAYNKIKGIV